MSLINVNGDQSFGVNFLGELYLQGLPPSLKIKHQLCSFGDTVLIAKVKTQMTQKVINSAGTEIMTTDS